jgi:hypothetical protein
MNIYATLEKKEDVEVINVGTEKIVLIIGCATFTMSRNAAEYIHKLLEQNLFDEDSWNVNLQKKVDMLQLKVSQLEENLLEYEEDK